MLICLSSKFLYLKKKYKNINGFYLIDHWAIHICILHAAYFQMLFNQVLSKFALFALKKRRALPYTQRTFNCILINLKYLYILLSVFFYANKPKVPATVISLSDDGEELYSCSLCVHNATPNSHPIDPLTKI